MPIEFSILFFVIMACVALYLTYSFFFVNVAAVNTGSLAIYIILTISIFAIMTVLGNTIDRYEATQFIQQHMRATQ